MEEPRRGRASEPPAQSHDCSSALAFSPPRPAPTSEHDPRLGASASLERWRHYGDCAQDAAHARLRTADQMSPGTCMISGWSATSVITTAGRSSRARR